MPPQKNREKLLAEKFIETYGNLEPWPPIHNISIFMSTNARTTEKHFHYYKENVPFPTLTMCSKSDSLIFTALDKFISMAKETFKEYWKNECKLKEIKEEYRKQEKILDEIYEKLTYFYVEKTEIKSLIEDSKKADAAAWMADGRSMCSISFDKEICLELLKELKMGISEKRLDEIWDTATIPISDSFEKRRLLYYLELLKHGLSDNEIAEKCDYFYGGFYDVPSLEDTKKKLKEKYKESQYNEELIKKTFEENRKEREERENQFSKWLSTLNKEEKKLVCYLQFIIELRDMRKDVYGKVLAIRYRIARKMFKQTDIPEKFIPYYTCSEMEKGLGYLKENKEEIESRENGFCALVYYDGKIEFQYGYFDENKKLMDAFYLEKNKSNVNEFGEIKGQPACAGKVVGKVKIVKNIKDFEKFNRGDILVTGMTRVEFVPLMKKASAIVTDEGGITCHAAIISRELKIPCIIGTKIATKILKDNDYVEVDAKKGIVKILKRS